MEYIYFVNLSSGFFITFIVVTLIGSILTEVLSWLNSDKRNIKNKISRLKIFSKISEKYFNIGKLKKSLSYKRERDNFNNFKSNISSGIETLLLIFGIVPLLISTISYIFPTLSMTYCFIVASLITSVIRTLFSIPFNYYENFSIEQRYGFNTLTKKLFIKDNVVSMSLGLVLSVPFLLFTNWAISQIADLTFTSICCMIVGIIAIIKIVQMLFVNVIMPIFNKFEPLSDDILKTKIQKLCKKCGYDISSIEVMDGSKRSKHSNAFICSSFGKKKLVLFDTLLKDLSHDEIVAVVAHEIGHSKLHHLSYGLISGIISFAFVMIISILLMKTPEFYTAFGYSWVNSTNITDNYLIGFTLASMFIGAFSWIFKPISSWISRKNEYAADNYAASVVGPKHLTNALIKITSKNMSDLFPHPIYEFVNYSHPSIINRLKSLKSYRNKFNKK
jgi:STE24 endopeptidase